MSIACQVIVLKLQEATFILENTHTYNTQIYTYTCMRARACSCITKLVTTVYIFIQSDCDGQRWPLENNLLALIMSTLKLHLMRPKTMKEIWSVYVLNILRKRCPEEYIQVFGCRRCDKKNICFVVLCVN